MSDCAPLRRCQTTTARPSRAEAVTVATLGPSALVRGVVLTCTLVTSDRTVRSSRTSRQGRAFDFRRGVAGTALSSVGVGRRPLWGVGGSPCGFTRGFIYLDPGGGQRKTNLNEMATDEHRWAQ